MPAIANPWIDESSPTEGGQEALAADAADPHETAGAFDDFGNECHQNFRRAVLLDEIEQHHRFRLDETAFMEALEPMPMFLQGEQAG